MEYDLYLSYSGWKTYQVCPARYQHNYILKTPVVKDPRSTFAGSAIGKIFEWFYSDLLWEKPDPIKACMDRVDAAIDDTFTKNKWNPLTDPSQRQILREELRKMIPDGIEIIRSNGFLTPYSRAEVDLTITYEHATHGLILRMGGRCDFIHSKDRQNVQILDGKASKHREKYVDKDQLIWYAIQHYIKYHVMPQSLGFIFWAFPQDPVSWIEFDNASIHRVIDSSFDVCKKIQLKVFPEKPSKDCYRCDYLSKCEEGGKHIARLRLESGGRIVDSIFLLEDVNDSGGG